MLTVIQRVTEGRHPKWLCSCSCGGEALVTYTHLVTTGDSRSCGCLRQISAASQGRRNRVHGESVHAGNTAEYRAWRGMLNRCHNPKAQDWARYGGRGVEVCASWRQSYPQFLKDMGRRPSPAYSVERQENDLGYSASNCAWETIEVQSNNKRSSRFVEHLDERLTVAQWSKRLGLNRGVLLHRLSAGWSLERALTPTYGRERNL